MGLANRSEIRPPTAASGALQNRLIAAADGDVAAGDTVEDFDFDLHLEADYMGAESSKLVYEGAGKYNGADFTFSGPISMLKLQYGLGKK